MAGNKSAIRAPGYWQCGRRIAVLHRFRGLLIHHQRWGMYIDSAPPLETLIKEDITGVNGVQALDREINKMILPVKDILFRLGVSTRVSRSEDEIRYKEGELVEETVRREWDLIDDYFDLPPSGGHTFELLIHSVDRGIGGLEFMRETAFRRMFNPLAWMAWVVRLPIAILQSAGVAMDDASAKGVAAIGWIMRVGMLLLIAFTAAKLGITIPWDRIVGFFK